VSVPDYSAPLENLDEAFSDAKIEENDMYLYIGIDKCIDAIEGLRYIPRVDISLGGISFFEIQLTDRFPERPVPASELERVFNCRIRVRKAVLIGSQLSLTVRLQIVFHLGKTVPGAAIVHPGDVLLAEGTYAVLHWQFGASSGVFCRLRAFLCD
jgi:hypothetical protein